MLPRIALDLDGVCYEWDKTARYMLRRKLAAEGRDIPPALTQESSHWMSIEDGIEDRDWMWLWSIGVEQGLFRYGHVVTGAIEGVRELSSFAEVHIVTARPKTARRDTIDWLSFFFDRSPIAGVHFMGDKTGFDAHLLVDDADHNIEAFQQCHGLDSTILFKRRWSGKAPGTQAVSWPELIFLARAKLILSALPLLDTSN